MKKLVLLIFISVFTLFLISLGIGWFTNIHWIDSSFFVGAGATVLSFFFSSSGDALSNASKAMTIKESHGNYTADEKEQPALFLNPFLIGALIFFILSFVFPYL